MDAITSTTGSTTITTADIIKNSDLLTAAHITQNCPANLQDIGKRVTAHLKQAMRHGEEALKHRFAAADLLLQAKEACDKRGFIAFREQFCPDLGRTRTYQLLAIATGKKTIDESRAENAERNRQHRAKQKAPEPTVRHVTDSAEAGVQRRKLVPKQETGIAWDIGSIADGAKRTALLCKQSAADALVVIEAAGVLDEMTIGAVIKAATDAKEACIAAAVAWQALTESVRK